MTQVISVIQEKGGAGKTTLLSMLCALMAKDGARLFGIDTDERQHFSNWLKKEKTSLDWTYEIDDERIGPTVRAIKKSTPPYDAVFIDTAGYKSATAIYAAQASDLILVPCMPDEDTIKDAIKTYRHIQNVADNAEKTIPAFVVIMNANPNANITKSTLEALDSKNLPRLNSMCESLTGFKEMKSTGEAPTGAALRSARQVLAELQRNDLIQFYGKGGAWQKSA